MLRKVAIKMVETAKLFHNKNITAYNRATKEQMLAVVDIAQNETSDSTERCSSAQ